MALGTAWFRGPFSCTALTGTWNPEPGTRNPEPRNPEPRNPEPRNPEPRNLEPGTWNPGPGTWNPEPRTRNLEPGTQDQEPGTWNPEPRTRNLEPGTWNPEPRTRTTRELEPRFRCGLRRGSSFLGRGDALASSCALVACSWGLLVVRQAPFSCLDAAARPLFVVAVAVQALARACARAVFVLFLLVELLIELLRGSRFPWSEGVSRPEFWTGCLVFWTGCLVFWTGCLVFWTPRPVFWVGARPSVRPRRAPGKTRCHQRSANRKTGGQWNPCGTSDLRKR